MQTPSKIKIRYENEPCSRCAGGGRYSYCQMYGSTCFKCGGNGKQLTRRGKAARKRVQAVMETFYKPAKSLCEGDQIRIPGYRWQAVVGTSEGGSRWLDKETGEWRTSLDIHLKGMAYSTGHDAIIQVRPTPEQFREQVVPVAEKLKGATVIRA